MTGRKHSRFSQRILWLALAILVAGGSVPVRAIATVQSAAAPNAAESAISKSGPNESAAEDENVYRHTPLVQSMAKAIHLDVETTARLFEFINFAIVALAIVIPLVRLMPRIFRKRLQTLQQDLDSARKLTEDAGSRLKAVEAKLARLDEEIAQMRTQVEEEGKHEEARIKAAIEEESSRVVASAEQEIAAAAAQAKRGLRHFAADLAIEHATKQLVLTPDTDRVLIAEFLQEASRNGSRTGGRN